MPENEASAPRHFLQQRIEQDVAAGKNEGRVATRFPPEPSGYLHVGHASVIHLNFGLAREFGGQCHLRFDDTNPLSMEAEFVEAIQEDIRWLGYDWGEHLHFASDYFDPLYSFAVRLVEKGHAFVCDLSAEEMSARRGSLTEPGRDSPYRERSVDENLDLFARMKAGEFEPGSRTLRARIDMGSPVLPMRDPPLYRIVRGTHHRTGDAWHVYPLYDFAHSLSDAIEGITHSICGLEFSDRRPLYDWILDHVEPPNRPVQIEVGELNITQTILSKRYLRRLIEEGHVSGWDDPRMPTLRGMRRRGVPARSLLDFCDDVGVGRRDTMNQLAQLEHHVRAVLNETAPRAMGVLNPLRVVLTNYPEGESEELPAVNNPQDASAGTRPVPFSRVLYIERDDFLEDPPRKFFRLAPGREVRLRYAYFITCDEVVKDAAGEIVELRCRYDPATRGGDAPDGRKVKGTLHWVSAEHAVAAEVRLYSQLFHEDEPLVPPEGAPADWDFSRRVQADSLEVVEARLEPGLAGTAPGTAIQLERLGYFCLDPDSTPTRPVLNRTATLRDTWAKVARGG